MTAPWPRASCCCAIYACVQLHPSLALQVDFSVYLQLHPISTASFLNARVSIRVLCTRTAMAGGGKNIIASSHIVVVVAHWQHVYTLCVPMRTEERIYIFFVQTRTNIIQYVVILRILTVPAKFHMFNWNLQHSHKHEVQLTQWRLLFTAVPHISTNIGTQLVNRNFSLWG